MTIADEAIALAATLPDPAFEALRAAGAAELDTVGEDDATCLQDLYNATVDRGIFESAARQAADDRDLYTFYAVAVQSQIDVLDAEIAALQAQIDAGGDQTAINRQIANGRQALKNARHYLFPPTIDPTGVADVTAAIKTLQTPSTTPNGTVSAPVTIDAWPGATYLLKSRLLVTGRTYTTFNFHGATTKAWPSVKITGINITGFRPAASGGGGHAATTTMTSNTPMFTPDMVGRGLAVIGNEKAPYDPTWVHATVVSNDWYFTKDPRAEIAAYVSPTQVTLANAAHRDGTNLSMYVSGAQPDPRNTSIWKFQQCTNVRVTNGFMLGSLPVDYFDYRYAFEGQHGIDIAGCTNLTIDHIEFDNFFGNFMACNAAVLAASAGGTVLSNGITIEDCKGRRTVRQFCAPVRQSNLIVRRNKFFDAFRSAVDIEAYTPSSIIDGALIEDNEFTNTGFAQVAAVCQGVVNNITIRNNKAFGEPFSVTASPTTYINSGSDGVWDESLQWHDWVITGNSGQGLSYVASGGGSGGTMYFRGIRNFTLTNNTQRMQVGGNGDPFMVLAVCTEMGPNRNGTTCTVSGNNLQDARLRPDGQIYQAKINGVYVPVQGTTPTARIGIPTTGCFSGGVINPKPPIVPGTQTIITATAQMETALGFKVRGHRIYTQPADGFLPNAKTALMNDDRDKGRISYLSLALPSGQTWGDMTRNPTLLQQAAEQIRDRSDDGCRIVLMADHEPDVGTQPTDNPQNSQASRLEYAAFQTAFFTKVKVTAPGVTRAMTYGGYKLYAGALTQAQALEYLPTDKSLLELIGDGPYNSTYGGGPSQPTFAQRIAKYLLLIAAYGKPGFIHEMGFYILQTPDRAAAWTAAIAHIKSHPEIKAMLCYHSDGNNDTEGEFWIDDTVPMFNAIKSSATGWGQSYFKPTDGG